MMEVPGGDEIPKSPVSSASDGDVEEPLTAPSEFDRPSVEEENEEDFDLEEEQGETRDYASESDASLTSPEQHNYEYEYTDDWETESSATEDEGIQSATEDERIESSTIEESYPKTDTPSLGDDKEETEGESSSSDRSYSPEPAVEELMTAARSETTDKYKTFNLKLKASVSVSMQSSSNESMTMKIYRDIRGRSRVRKTKLRTSNSCKGSGESKTIYEYSSAPVSIGRSEDGDKQKERMELLTSMDAGDIKRVGINSCIIRHKTT